MAWATAVPSTLGRTLMETSMGTNALRSETTTHTGTPPCGKTLRSWQRMLPCVGQWKCMFHGGVGFELFGPVDANVP